MNVKRCGLVGLPAAGMAGVGSTGHFGVGGLLSPDEKDKHRIDAMWATGPSSDCAHDLKSQC